jgi:glutamyl-tRNA(Gln) amidotransferase subunit D
MNVYSTGRKILSAGVISVRDMLPETAYVKLVWALGQTDNINEVKTIMQTNIAGEIGEKSSEKFFLN